MRLSALVLLNYVHREEERLLLYGEDIYVGVAAFGPNAWRSLIVLEHMDGGTRYLPFRDPTPADMLDYTHLHIERSGVTGERH